MPACLLAGCPHAASTRPAHLHVADVGRVPRHRQLCRAPGSGGSERRSARAWHIRHQLRRLPHQPLHHRRVVLAHQLVWLLAQRQQAHGGHDDGGGALPRHRLRLGGSRQPQVARRLLVGRLDLQQGAQLLVLHDQRVGGAVGGVGIACSTGQGCRKPTEQAAKENRNSCGPAGMRRLGAASAGSTGAQPAAQTSGGLPRTGLAVPQPLVELAAVVVQQRVVLALQEHRQLLICRAGQQRAAPWQRGHCGARAAAGAGQREEEPACAHCWQGPRLLTPPPSLKHWLGPPDPKDRYEGGRAPAGAAACPYPTRRWAHTHL